MRLELWFDYSCPYAYLASTQAEALAARTAAELAWKPFLLGGVFRAHGTPQNLSNVLSPPKALHNARDLERWAEAFAVPFAGFPAGHPFRTVEALRATLVSGIDPRVIHAFYRAYWLEHRAPSDRDLMREALSSTGHDAERVLARVDDPAVKDDLRARTDEAIALGIFGAPAWVVRAPSGPLLFWGQDRIEFVEKALRGWVPGGRTGTGTGTGKGEG
jgi:2-hydroxychromene-2-carboxylate isomerase